MKTEVHKKQLGMRIQEKRIEKKWTQEKLADSVGLSPVYISSIERGIKLPSLSTAVNIVNALGASLDYLLEKIWFAVIKKDCWNRISGWTNFPWETKSGSWQLWRL